jgi:teichuronic acid biosynthesis glycosyltransferase TuaG
VNILIKKPDLFDDGVDVILPCFNSEATIEKTLDSVMQQDCLKELYIVDDCSTDNTVKTIKKYLAVKYNNPKFVHVIENEVNLGAGVARNLGIAAAKSRYIAFIDSDDLWVKIDHLRSLRSLLQSNEWAVFAYTNFKKKKINGEISGPSKFFERHTFDKQLVSTFIAGSSTVIDTSRSGKFLFDKRRTGQDYMLWLDLLRIGDAAGSGQCSLHINKRNDSLSKSKIQTLIDLYEIQHFHNNIPATAAVINIIRFLVGSIIKFR